MSNNLYNEFSIEHKDPREFTRLKPQVYVGSTEYTTQLMIEIISNSNGATFFIWQMWIVFSCTTSIWSSILFLITFLI